MPVNLEVSPVGTYVLIKTDLMSESSYGGNVLLAACTSDATLLYGEVIDMGTDVTCRVQKGSHVAFIDTGYAIDDSRVLVDQKAIVAIISSSCGVGVR